MSKHGRSQNQKAKGLSNERMTQGQNTLNLHQYTGLAKNNDQIGRSVYRTLEVNEDISRQEYSRIKSEDRTDKRRKKSSKRRRNELKYNPNSRSKHSNKRSERLIENADKLNYVGTQGHENENSSNHIENKYNFDRALSCDMKSEQEESQQLSSSNVKYYNTIKAQDVRKADRKLNIISEDLSSSGLDNVIYDEYLRLSSSSGIVKKMPINSELQTTKANGSYKYQSIIAEKGLFSKNERINERKQYFHNFGENLNKQSLE